MVGQLSIIHICRMFTNKNQYFKSDEFLAEEKKNFTELINQYIDNPKERLKAIDTGFLLVFLALHLILRLFPIL